MIFRRLGLIHKNQRGIAMLELTMALLVTGLIASSIIITISQVFSGNTRSSNHMLAVRQVQSAGYWVSHDTQMAGTVTPTADPDGFPLTLTWTDWDSTPHQVVYTLVGSELRRDYDSQETRVAEFINPDPAMTNCVFANGKLTLTVTATVDTGSQQGSETRTYEVVPRPD